MAGNKIDEDEKTSKETVDNEIHIKHPLQNRWTLWYFENDRKKCWSENLKEITSFDTVEDFWSIYNHIKAPSDLRTSNDYYLFKTGIRPEWEDEANKQGGKWVVNIERKPKMERDQDLDSAWLEMMLCLIGESFEEHTDEICGSTVNMRQKADKICLWIAHSHKQSAMPIGRILKERLRLSDKQQLTFSLHSDAQAKGGSVNAKNYYTI